MERDKRPSTRCCVGIREAEVSLCNNTFAERASTQGLDDKAFAASC